MGHFRHTLFIQPTRLVKQRWGVFLEAVELSCGVQKLGDVQRDQLREGRVVGDAFEAVQGHLRLAIEVGDVAEVVLGRGLEFALHVQDVVQVDAGLLECFTLEQAVSQFEAELVALGLGQVSNTDVHELLGRPRVILPLVVVVRELPVGLKGERAFWEVGHEPLHPNHGILVVQRQGAHGRMVARVDEIVRFDVVRVVNPRFEGVQGQGVTLLVERFFRTCQFRGAVVCGLGPLGRGLVSNSACGGQADRHGHWGQMGTKGEVGHGSRVFFSKLPSPPGHGWSSELVFQREGVGISCPLGSIAPAEFGAPVDRPTSL